jgi:hypothetical protein
VPCAVTSRYRLILFGFVEQVLHRLEALGCTLQSFNLLTQLFLLGLFLTQDFEYVFQERPPTGLYCFLSAGSNDTHSARVTSVSD